MKKKINLIGWIILLILFISSIFLMVKNEEYIETVESSLNEKIIEYKELDKTLSETEEKLMISNDKLKQIEMRNEGIKYQEEIQLGK